MSDAFDAIIIGGGVVGLSAALHLTDAGMGRVLVLERRVLASGGSGLGSGSVHRQRWNATDAALIGRTMRRLEWLKAASNGMFQLYPVGRLTVVGEADRAAMSGFGATLRGMGVAAKELTPDEMAARFPGLTVGDLAAGLYTGADGVLYPPALVWALAGSLRNAGGVIWEGCGAARIVQCGGKVQGVALANGEVMATGRVIVAAGVWSAQVMQASGLDLALTHSVTHATVVTVGRQDHWPTIPSLLDGVQGLIAIPRNPGTIICATVTGERRAPEALANRVLGSATVEVLASDEGHQTARERQYADALRMARHRFAGSDVRGVAGDWAGLLDGTPDNHPLLGPVAGVAGLWVGCGLTGFGVQRGPGVGEALAEMALGRPTTVDVAAYAPGRFDAGQPITLDLSRDNPFKGFRQL